ncbi:MAG: hypothetical protein Q8O67_10455 [Deltaproteobacteria bacterium]|nr:hypothetical protein [Deltaproteobacteria bacterium]
MRLVALMLLASPSLLAAGEFDRLPDDEIAGLAKSGAVVVGPNALSAPVARAMASRLRARGLVILGDDALAAPESARDDRALVALAKDLPVDVVVVVRVYSGDSAPDTATIIAYDKKGKAILTKSAVAALSAIGDKTPWPEEKPKTKPSSSSSALTVVVIDPPESPLDKALATEVSARFTHGLSTVARYAVTSSADLKRLLDLEANKQMAGCSTGECLAEIGDALGATRALSWSATERDDVVTLDFALYETKGSVVIGRGQAQGKGGSLVADVDRAFGKMLREVLRKESGADPDVAARARFAEEQLAIVERRTAKNPWIPVPVPVVGAHEVPIEWPDFYRRAGRDDLAGEAETRDGVLYLGILPLLGASFLSAAGGVVGAILVANDDNPEYVPVSLGIGFGVGAVSFTTAIVSLVVFADHMPVEEKRKIADEHNELLRQRLSLPAP